MRVPVVIAVLLAMAAAGGITRASATSPYAGEEAREVKALSSSDVAGLLAGEGLGYAKAAELNGYPGPSHVLALAEQLGLSPGQRQETQAIFDRMQAEARNLGAALVAAERELDQRFADTTIDPTALAELTGRIGAIEARLRAAHLSAHLEQAAVLDATQVQRYMALRGYADGGQGHEHHHAPAAGDAAPGATAAPDAGTLSATETAFARTMADRDFAAFAGFIHEDAVFLNGGRPLRGKAAFLAHWKAYFDGSTAPFAWAPEIAEVSATTGLGYTEGPVSLPDGSSHQRFYSVWQAQPHGQWKIVFDNGYRVCDCPPSA